MSYHEKNLKGTYNKSLLPPLPNVSTKDKKCTFLVLYWRALFTRIILENNCGIYFLHTQSSISRNYVPFIMSHIS